MLLSWLSRSVSSLLVLSLCGLVVSTVMNQTLMSKPYLEGQFSKADAYSRLSTALSKEVSQQAGVAGNPQAAGAISSVLTQAAIKQNVDTTLNKLTEYYQGKGPAPTIDLTQFAPQVQALGISLPGDSDLSRPVKLLPGSSTSRPAANPGRNLAVGRAALLVSSVLLTVVLLALSFARHKYTALPNVCIAVGILIAIGALILHFAPGAFNSRIKLDSTSNAFTLLGRDIVTNILNDLARRFGFIAGGFLVVGIGSRVVLARLRPKPPKTTTSYKTQPAGTID